MGDKEKKKFEPALATCLVMSLIRQLRDTGILSDTEGTKVLNSFVELSGVGPETFDHESDDHRDLEFALVLSILAGMFDPGIAKLIEAKVGAHHDEAL